MTEDSQHQIVPGIHLSESGEVTTEPHLHDVLCDMAIAMEDACDLPVDVEHVVAAIVMAADKGRLSRDREISARDPELRSLLVPFVRRIFEEYDGQICGEQE